MEKSDACVVQETKSPRNGKEFAQPEKSQG